MYPPITYKLLKSKNATDYQLALFKEHFGLEPILLTDEVIEKFDSTFDIDWAAESLLTYTDFLEYKKVRDPAYAEYKKVTKPVVDDYSERARVELAEYKKVTKHTMSEGISVTHHIWIELLDVTKDQRSEYKKIAAKEFSRIYQGSGYTPLKRIASCIRWLLSSCTANEET